MENLIILKYNIIDELRGSSTDYRATEATIFKDQVMELFERGWNHTTFKDYFNPDKQSNNKTRKHDKNFIIVIQGQYLCNQPAIEFLSQLGITPVLLQFEDTIQNEIVLNRPLMNISEVDELLSGKRFELGNLPVKGNNLLEEDNLTVFSKTIEKPKSSSSSIYGYLYPHNLAIRAMVIEKGYQFGVSCTEGFVKDVDTGIVLRYNLPSYDMTFYQSELDYNTLFDKFDNFNKKLSLKTIFKKKD